MALIYGQLESAQFENKTADYSATASGRVWWRTDTGVAKIANGSAVRQFLINDGNAVIGNSVTANNNIRLHRGASGVLQFVTGGDVTAEGTLSTSLNQISGRLENYTDAGKPAFGNAGRLIWTTDLVKMQADTGSAWIDVSLGVRTALSILGVTGNSNAAAADIVASTDVTALRRAGTSVAFGKLSLDYLTGTHAAKTTNYTTTVSDNYVKLTASGGAWTLTLHTPTYNQFLLLERTDTTLANAITITGTISGATDWKMHTAGETLLIMYSTTDSEWKLVNHHAETDWIDGGTLTITAESVNPTKGTTDIDKFYYKRSGKNIYLKYKYHQSAVGLSATGTGGYIFALPITVDSTPIVATGAAIDADLGGTDDIASIIGWGFCSSNIARGDAKCVLRTTTSFSVSAMQGVSGAYATVAGSTNYDLTNGNIAFFFEIGPLAVSGWKP